MKRWIALLLTVTVVFIMIVSTAPTQTATIEGFGIFGGCNTIAYNKLVNDMYTPDELQNFFTNTRNTQIPDQKNSLIATWDQMACSDQNDYYTLVTTEKTKRAAVDSLAPPPAPITSTTSS
jgi:hypothetical protein